MNNKIQLEGQETEREKKSLQNQKENHVNLNNKIGELRNCTETLNKEINKLKEKVVEDPEETLKKRNESKSRLENSTKDLIVQKTKLKQLMEYLTKNKIKAEIAAEFAKKLSEIIQIIKENNDYKNKLDETKHMKKDTESELI